MRGEISELCEFTQRLYLGMPSSHEVRRQKMQKLALKKQASLIAVPAPMPTS
jgi:hypothetical protein